MDAFFTDNKFGPGTTIKSTEWDDEIKQMQEFVMNNPNAIFSHLPPGTKFAMLARELRVDGGEVDFVFVDEHGEFYIVETKLKKNTTKRKIFAQVDDYACSIWAKLKIDQDVDGFFSLCEENLQDELKEDSLVLDNYLQRELNLDDSPEKIKKEIKDNINSHNITFVVVMDELDEDLQQQIIYRVDQKITTYGIELQKYQLNDKTLVVPNVFRLKPPITGKKSYLDWFDGEKNPIELVWKRYTDYVKTNQEFDANLSSAILQLISKFDEWKAIPWLHLTDMSLIVYFKKIKNYSHVPIKIQTDGKISLRTDAFDDDQKTLDEFRNDISNFDQDIKDKISAGRIHVRVPHEIWVPKVSQLIQMLEKFCK